ncbi:MAG: ParA family protein [Xanthomonadaceae bacterium]|jgi:chromosome partitioning protein|nr:ParA family protein [Xanthomonadaceae bacterium]
MKTILVAGSKGGVGKTTISTHLAAYYALSGKLTVLADADPQGSASRWAERQREHGGTVVSVDVSRRRSWPGRIPDDAEYVVIDAAAGALADDLDVLLGAADAVVVPVLPSALDIEAIIGFLNSLAKVARVHQRQLPVGLVLNRAKPWTNASQQAMEVLQGWPYPLVACLRDTQAYAVMVGLGYTLFDYRSAQVRDHQSDWEPLLKWLTKA